MQRISGHKEVNISIPSTGEVYRRLIRKLPKHRLILKNCGSLDKWAHGIREGIRKQEAGYKSFHLAAKNFIFECLDEEARELCSSKLMPEDNPRTSVEEY